jgi:hypothetical protein
MTRGAKLALIPLALIPALALAYFGGVLPAPRPSSQEAYTDSDWAAALQAISQGDTAHARLAVARYLAEVRGAGPSSRPHQFPGAAEVEAFWLNVYDAIGLEASLRHGGAPGAFSRAVVPHPIDGRYLTLNAIERRLKASGDPRIYFGLTLGRPGEPPLPDQPFRGATLDVQLNQAARRFFEEPRNIRISDGVLHLAPLLGEDLRRMAEKVPEQSLLQLVWTFLPRACASYPGCVTRADLDQACGDKLDRCQIRFDADARSARR